MNWGNKLLLTFIVFAAGMGYLVYRSLHVNFELVEKDYYKSELLYQDVIDGTNRVNKLGAVNLDQNDKGILLQLPVEMKNQLISGDIWFYCAYDEKKDKRFPLQLTPAATQQFDTPAIMPGRYSVKISWTSDGNKYFSEKKLLVK